MDLRRDDHSLDLELKIGFFLLQKLSYNLHKGPFSLSAIFSILSFTAIITP